MSVAYFMDHISLAGSISLTHPLIMGIINCTPDSFAVRSETTEEAVALAKKMIAEGADILDIGGESSRPGSDPVSEEIELKRTIPVIEKIRTFSDIPISIDTVRSTVAQKALTAGADIVNDISALQTDDRMVEVVGQSKCPVVLMHMKGQPKSMQNDPHYDDVIKEVAGFFENRIAHATTNGIAHDKIILDVGIGFGKRTVDNLMLLKHLKNFQKFGCPLLVGASRKNFIGDITGADLSDRREGSLAVATVAVTNGANIIRVHDVAETKQAISMAQAINEV